MYQVEKEGTIRALKLALVPEGAQDDRQTHARTVRELLCLLLLDHPNIVRVLAHGRWANGTGTHVYLVLEYVEGCTLAKWIERAHPTAMELIHVFVKLAAAVAHMHARGVFHRDLKLSNVLVRQSGGEPVIIDFGAGAFTLAQELTDGGLPPGTDRFRAPEAHRWWWVHRKQPTARYDFRVTDELFAFGVMLHDALTDPRPSEVRDRSAVNHSVIPARAPEERNPRIPAALACLVRRLLARNPADRPENFEAARRELAELLEHQGAEYHVPVHAPSSQLAALGEAAPGDEPGREAAPGERHWRWGKKLLAGGAVSAAVLAGVAASMGGGAVSEPPSAPTRAVWGPPPPAAPAPASVPVPPPATLADPGASVRAPLSKEGANVKTPKRAAPAAPPSQPPRFANEAERLKWCKAAAAIGIVTTQAACPGAQRMPARYECSPEAEQAADRLGLDTTDRLQLVFDGKGSREDRIRLKEGKVEVEVTTVAWDSDFPGRKNLLPPGTRLFGYIWARSPYRGDEDIAIAHFTRAQLPNGGPEIPVCIVPYNYGEVTVMERPEPGVVIIDGGWYPAQWSSFRR